MLKFLKRKRRVTPDTVSDEWQKMRIKKYTIIEKQGETIKKLITSYHNEFKAVMVTMFDLRDNKSDPTEMRRMPAPYERYYFFGGFFYLKSPESMWVVKNRPLVAKVSNGVCFDLYQDIGFLEAVCNFLEEREETSV